MKIAIISDWNIAGQLTALMRAINKYDTGHEARCIIAHDDDFQYDKDIILSEQTMEEASRIVNEADFFFFGRGIFNWNGINFNKLLTPHNCCIKYFGSELRNDPVSKRKYHDSVAIQAITGTDWSITGLLPNSIYHLGSYFTALGDCVLVDDLPQSNVWMGQGGAPLKICAGSAGSPMKGYDFLAQTIEELKAEGLKIELQIMAGMSNKQCLESKRQAQITFTSLHGAWGISGIESMLLGHTVLSCLDPWIMTFYPENPTVIICRENLKSKIKELYQNPGMIYSIGQASKRFALANFNTRIILKKYLYLFDLIMHREEYLKGGKNPETIYDMF
jgi:hypothetical protein